MARERAAFFSQFEQEIILKTFEEYKAIITAKCNTAAAAKSRVEAWQKIAERLNASNPNNVKRTWQQVKVKYKNIVQCANRKRAQKQMLSGGQLPASGFTPAEELALWQIRGRPMMDGIAWAGSSEQAGLGVRSPSSTEAESSGPLIQPVPTIIDSAEEPIDHSDSDHDEKNIVVCSHSEEGNDAFTVHEEPGPSGPFRHADEESDEDVTSLYKRYLRQEIAYRQLKMKKLEKEIQLLDKKLDFVYFIVYSSNIEVIKLLRGHQRSLVMPLTTTGGRQLSLSHVSALQSDSKEQPQLALDFLASFGPPFPFYCSTHSKYCFRPQRENQGDEVIKTMGKGEDNWLAVLYR
ncbi:hypothetical protein MHYP_G00001490 [Metynnis hypsauchen]